MSELCPAKIRSTTSAINKLRGTLNVLSAKSHPSFESRNSSTALFDESHLHEQTFSQLQRTRARAARLRRERMASNADASLAPLCQQVETEVEKRDMSKRSPPARHQPQQPPHWRRSSSGTRRQSPTAAGRARPPTTSRRRRRADGTRLTSAAMLHARLLREETRWICEDTLEQVRGNKRQILLSEAGDRIENGGPRAVGGSTKSLA
jgi:hypothetical protein